MIQIKFIDLFSGIGCFRFGFEKAGFTCAGHCEIDEYANKSYHAMHDVKGDEWFEKDICKVSSEQLPVVPIWTAGTPCQNFSVAGDRSGLQGNRSGLFFELIRLLRGLDFDHKPRWIILENVKGILSASDTRDFGIVLYELAALGYGIEYALLNSKNFGVPQNRERVYIICDLTGRSIGKIFPIGRANESALKQVIGGPQGSRIYDTSGLSPTITSGSGGLGAKTGLYLIDLCETPVITDNSRCIVARYDKGISKRKSENSGVLHSNLPRAFLTPNRLDKRQNGRRMKDENEEMFTLTATDIHGIMQNSRIRKLTPKECFRLQGIEDKYFEKAAEICSDAQLYRQAGNAVTVNVVYEIANRIREIVEEENLVAESGDKTNESVSIY